MSLENWKRIQKWAGVAADGIPGSQTAKAIMLKTGIDPQPFGNLVKGTGENIQRIFVHCTATREGQDIDAATITRWHKGQGWRTIGYHFVIRLDGEIERGRPEDQIGSHVKGFNRGSIGVVYVGGLDKQGKPADTRTEAQTRALKRLLSALTSAYPNAEVLGHRDASPDKDGDGVVEPHEWLKACPSFDVRKWWSEQ